MRTPATACAAALILLLVGCGGQPADHADHDNDGAVLRRTAWTVAREYHLELDAPVAGVRTPFLLQVTDLSGGGPVGDGPATLLLDDGHGRGGALELAASAHPGTWEGVLTFPAAGDWTVSLTMTEPDGTLPLGVIPVAADAHAAAHDAPNEDGIVMDKERQWLLGVRTAPAAADVFHHVLRVPGTVTAPADRKAAVSSPAAGLLAAPPDGRLPRPGDRVAAGDLLALVHPATEAAAAYAAARADLAHAEAGATVADAELTRARTLAADGAAAARRQEEAQAAADAAQADLLAARRAAHAYHEAGLRVRDGAVVLELTAPLAGVVTEVLAGPGEYVEPTRPVLTLLDPSEVWLRGLVPEADAPLLTASPTASFRVPGSVAVPIPMPADALISVGVAVDHGSRTVPVLYRLDNAHALPVGTTVDMYLRTRRSERGVVVPAAAVVEADGRAAVFVQRDGATFERRLVDVGGRDGRHVLVRSGVAPGERVVTASPYSVLLAAEATSVPAHGHAH